MFIKPQKELNLPEYVVLKVVKPLFGKPENVRNWNLTYLEHNLDELFLSIWKADKFMLVGQKDAQIYGLVAPQVDNSFFLNLMTSYGVNMTPYLIF